MRRDFFMLFDTPADRYTARGLVFLGVLYAGALAAAALLAPPVFWLVQAWAQSMPNELNRYLSGKPFPDYFDRVRWLPVLIGLPLLFRHCRLWSWRALGFDWRPGTWLLLLRYWLVGVLMLVPVLALQVFWGGAAWRSDLELQTVAGVLLLALAGGFLIGILEEMVFRGLIFRFFVTAVPIAPAIVLGSLFFAYVHFKVPDEIWARSPGTETVGWLAGWKVAYWMVVGIAFDFKALWFFNYFLTGVVLTLLFLRSRSLWSCVGLHAGWVSVILSERKLFAPLEFPVELITGTHRMIDGWIATILLASTALWLLAAVRRKDGTHAV